MARPDARGGWLGPTCFLVLAGCPAKSRDDSTEKTSVTADAVYSGDFADELSGTDAGDDCDINGDGYADITVGTYHHTGDATVIGAVVYGSDSPGSTPLSAADASFSDPQAVAYQSQFMAVGDVNADGYDDILVAQSWSCLPAALLFLGGPELGAFTADDAIATFSEQDDCLGAAHVGRAGDLNGDGFSDVFIDTGNLFLILGSEAPTSGLPSDLGVEFVPEGGGASAYGRAGDVDGDGLDDAIVTVAGDALTATPGEFYLSRGSSEVYTGAVVYLMDDVRITDPAAVYPPYDTVGGFRAGDVDGDGYDDLLIVSDKLYLFAGQSTPAWTAVTDAAVMLPGMNGGAGGDVDADGYADIVVAEDAESAGIAYGSTSLATVVSAPPVLASSWAVEASGGGDVNADGFSDWVVGVPEADADGLDEAGITYLFLGGLR